MNKHDNTTLELTEPHPAARLALDYIRLIPMNDLLLWQESFASNAIEGNRTAEICLGTLRRLIAGDAVSDRYVLGLAWILKDMREGESDNGTSISSEPS